MDEFNSIKDISYEKKLSCLVEEFTFLGMNEKNVFKIDTRLNSKKAAAESKTYTQNNKFTTLASKLNIYNFFF